MRSHASSLVSPETLAGVRGGDPRAERELWRACWPVVHSVCSRILGEGFSANEVSVEVLADFMSRYVHKLGSPQALRTYLQLMAARRSGRERERAARPVSGEMDDFADAPDVTPEERVSFRLLAPRLESCLGELTPKAQQVMKLRYFGDLTTERIGELVGGSKQYIGRLVTTCLAALRTCLERAPRAEGGGA